MADQKLSNLVSQLESFDLNDAKNEMSKFYNLLRSTPSLPKSLISKYMTMSEAERQAFLQNPATQAELEKYVNSALKVTSEAERLQSKFENVLGSQKVVNEAISESQKAQMQEIKQTQK